MIVTFLKSYKIIDDKIAHWRKTNDKHEYLKHFSASKWDKTPKFRKNVHSLKNCLCCQAYHTPITAKFPENKNRKNNKKKSPFCDLTKKAQNTVPKKAEPNKGELKQIANLIYTEYDKVCKENLGKSFTDVLVTLPQANLQVRESPNERRKKQRQRQRDVKSSIEQMWHSNDVDSHLAQRTSFSARTQQRLHQSFETIREAKERLEKTPPSSKERSHCPSSIEGDLDKLEEDAKSWPVGVPINWSEKAIQYKIKGVNCNSTPQNAGQILKEYLRAKGVDIHMFDKEERGKPLIIRTDLRNDDHKQ